MCLDISKFDGSHLVDLLCLKVDILLIMLVLVFSSHDIGLSIAKTTSFYK